LSKRRSFEKLQQLQRRVAMWFARAIDLAPAQATILYRALTTLQDRLTMAKYEGESPPEQAST
jgi:hypothetical protein